MSPHTSGNAQPRRFLRWLKRHLAELWPRK